MGNASNKAIEKIKTHFFGYCLFENRAVREIMWKNIVKPDRPQMTIWRVRIVCYT
jgi:hypothetical protein